MSSFKNDVRAIIHSVYQAGINHGEVQRKNTEAQAIASIMKKHRANYSIHFAKAARKGKLK